MENKQFTNLSPQTLRFSIDNEDYTVAPGASFTAPACPYTDGLLAKGLAKEGEPEEAAGSAEEETAA